MKFSKSLLGAAAAVALLASTSASAVSFNLNIPTGATYGTVTLTQFDGNTVAVHVDLADAYNFVDTGSHEAFGFNVLGAATITDISPGTAYSATGTFSQSAFGTFTLGVACSSPTCQGGNNSSSPNDILDFHVNLAGITVGSRFLVYQSRVEYENHTFIGRRTDTLRRHGDSWLIARRELILEQNVLLAKNLSILF